VKHSYYKYYALLDHSALSPGWTRDRLAAEIQRMGVPCGPGSCPEIYLEKALAPFAPSERCPAARQLGESSLMLLVHPTLTPAHIDSMARRICDVFLMAASERPRLAA
jgi:dTDP-4-amino-4,6-dideoxygalactose transaminase